MVGVAMGDEDVIRWDGLDIDGFGQWIGRDKRIKEQLFVSHLHSETSVSKIGYFHGATPNSNKVFACVTWRSWQISFRNVNESNTGGVGRAT